MTIGAPLDLAKRMIAARLAMWTTLAHRLILALLTWTVASLARCTCDEHHNSIGSYWQTYPMVYGYTNLLSLAVESDLI